MEWITTLMAEVSMAEVSMGRVSKGGVSRQTSAAAFPPHLFYCLLDDLPMHLLPQRFRVSPQVPNQVQGQQDALYLNPDCELRPAQDLPHELKANRDLLSTFALQGTIAWVCDSKTRDSASGSLLPFWLGPHLDRILQGLRPNEPVSSLPANERALLAAAGILISERREGERRTQREEALARAASKFRQKDYAPLSDLIHPFHVAALRRYYRHLIRTGKIKLGDRQSPRRYVAYNEPVARFFHQQIAPVLSTVAGQALKPSYVYVASYLSGAELKKHTDRAQCEFSITLCLDFSPEPACETSWPIRLDTPQGTVAVYQGLGDGLVYRGTSVPHYRTPLPAGQTSTSIFFHYVAENFEGSLD